MSAHANMLDAEWLEPDGSGGFASGTIGGERTRRYHALLLTASTPPTGRLVLVNGAESWVENSAGRIPLTTHRYLPDVVYPDGYRHIAEFSRDPWPRWTFVLPDGAEIMQEILVPEGTGETILRWRRLRGSGPCKLNVRLLLSGRDYHGLHHENPTFDFNARCIGFKVCWQPYASVPAITALTNGAYSSSPEWYRDFLYTAERDRGLDCSEDLASPGVLSFDLDRDGGAVIVLRAGDSAFGDAEPYAESLAAVERQRRSDLAPLARSARSYVARRQNGKTVIAGYPWFADWGRDTFIAMRGLLLASGDLATAEAILYAWAETVSEGMLPNRFLDRGEAPEYNAVDA